MKLSSLLTLGAQNEAVTQYMELAGNGAYASHHLLLDSPAFADWSPLNTVFLCGSGVEQVCLVLRLCHLK